jgi:O-antigen biosynthesis protein
MSVNVSPGLATDAEDAEALAVSFAGAGNVTASRLDLAEVAGRQLLVYGWIVNFSKSVDGATIQLGDFSVDLIAHAVPVRRPDVAQHFALDPSDEEHGFYSLLDLPAHASATDHLILRTRFSSGEVSESRWPVVLHDTRDDFFREPYLATLSQLLRKLPKLEAKRLVDFVGPSLKLRVARENARVLPPPVEFAIDLCCLLGNRMLVVAGWRVDPFKEITIATLRVGGSAWPLWNGAISFARTDIKHSSAGSRRPNTAELPGFIFVHELPAEDLDKDEAVVDFSVGEAIVHITHAVSSLPHEGRRDLLSYFEKMEPDTALTLSKRIASDPIDASGEGWLASLMEYVGESALERLSSSIQHDKPRYFLHLDQAIPVATSGIFLTGWFNSGPGTSVGIVCHCDHEKFSVSENWFRHLRADVSSHLANLGIQPVDHAHGFTCYVPLSPTGAPYYISATTESGESRHLRVPLAGPPDSAPQTIRSLLTSFHSGHPELRLLLDRQIGPAVSAAWRGARKPPRTPIVRAYGTISGSPLVSIIVPLYGRHDFAAYQMALFADDPEFQNIELIYVVDDPAILADFSRVCEDLHGVYDVPFLVVSCGLNLGFAGANNLGSEVARGQYLLFLNSDVMPSRAQWVGDLLRTYRALTDPGMLGAKLLYEDGSLQHTGIAFRRNPGWGNLWINDHPLKGQSPLGLGGVRKVDAVTAACALVEASLFRGVEGFSEDYIIGDFEDSDLCLRLDLEGRASYVDLDVELYHLERQSQNRFNDVNWRANLTLYNCWLHNTRWDRSIASRAGESPSSVVALSDHRDPAPVVST